MRFATVLAAAGSLALAGVAQAAHGDGSEGSIMGPVSFLWPDDREWDSADDNIGPCGSSEGVTERTEFPLSQGSVALSIADEAYKVAFYIAFDNNPKSQTQFEEQVVDNVTEIFPGHQCYKIDGVPSTVAPGDNATIQLQYWADYPGENDGKNQTFFACADITFVADSKFTGQIPCFNVTASDFDGATSVPTGTAASTSTAGSASQTTSAVTTSKSSSGLSGGAKAGIAVGSVVGGLAILGLAAFLIMRRRRSGYLDRRRASRINAPIPLNKRNPDGTSITSN